MLPDNWISEVDFFSHMSHFNFINFSLSFEQEYFVSIDSCSVLYKVLLNLFQILLGFALSCVRSLADRIA